MDENQNNSDRLDNISDKEIQEYLKMQIRQQAMKQAQEEQRLAREEEEKRKQIEFAGKVNEYKEKCAQIHANALKKWAGSWVVLVLAILSTVALCFTLISALTNLSVGLFPIIIALVKLLLASLVCAGFWRSYAMGRSKNSAVNAGGPRMLRGVLIFDMVMMYIAMSLITVLVLIIVFGLKTCADNINGWIGQIPSEDVSDAANAANTAITGMLFGLLVVVLIIYAVLIIYYTFASRFSKDVVTSLTSGVVSPSKTLGIAVLFFIFGGISVLSVITSVASLSFLNSLIGSLGEAGEFLSLMVFSSKTGVYNILSELVSAGTSIFAGILAIKFGGLNAKTEAEIQSLEKPVM